MAKLLVVLALVAAAAAVPAPRTIDPNESWRIVGGSDASAGQFPYIISLRSSGSHICGGSILNENYIVTAAHCVDGANAGSLSVVAGSHLLNSGGDTYRVASIKMHESYDSWNIRNDIAVIRVASPISMNSNVQAIPMETSDVGGGADAVLCGWGRTSYPGNIPNNLQFIDLKTVSVSQCQSAHSPNPVYDTQVCTLTRSGEGACHGDSGGPLASGGRQIGVVSWGIPCAQGYPDVFTRVSSFTSWINANTK